MPLTIFREQSRESQSNLVTSATVKWRPLNHSEFQYTNTSFSTLLPLRGSLDSPQMQVTLSIAATQGSHLSLHKKSLYEYESSRAYIIYDCGQRLLSRAKDL